MFHIHVALFRVLREHTRHQLNLIRIQKTTITIGWVMRLCALLFDYVYEFLILLSRLPLQLVLYLFEALNARLFALFIEVRPCKTHYSRSLLFSLLNALRHVRNHSSDHYFNYHQDVFDKHHDQYDVH